MKKIVSLLMACIMVFSLCACGSDDESVKKANAFSNDARNVAPSADAVSVEPGNVDKKDGDYMVAVSGAKEAEMDKGIVITLEDLAYTGSVYTVPVTVYNNTDHTLMCIYISAADDPSWGSDLLGMNSILDYSYGTINMNVYGCATEYNVCLIYDDGTKYKYAAIDMGDRDAMGFGMLISQEMGMTIFLED